jgi:copper(I)-binding protein
MKRAWKAAATALIFAAFAAEAHEFKLGSLTIADPWARPTAGPNKLGAAYFTLKNDGQEADRLESMSSPDADRVELHENLQGADGVMKMRPVEGGLVIPPGGTVQLQPGGYHLMLMGLSHNLEEGQHLPLKLTFAHAGSVEVEVHVEKSPASGGMHEHHH